MLRKKLTRFGVIARDPSGLHHYHCEMDGCDIWKALEDALDHKMKARPLWFWFNDTPAPILTDDTPESLNGRWREWRETHQTGAPSEFLALVRNFSRPPLAGSP